MIKIVAFLQNQWFKDPERMEAMYEMWKIRFPDDYREKWIRTWLFYRCLTGIRLREALGWDLCSEIVWDEVSPKIGAVSSSCFRPDLEHMENVIIKHKPKVVLLFGAVAQQAFELFKIKNCLVEPSPIVRILRCPHPAARGKGITEKLSEIATKLSEIIAKSVDKNQA